MNYRAILLAVASATLALGACASSPSSQPGTAITATSHTAEHTAPVSHSPIPAHTTAPRKITTTPTAKVIKGGTFCSIAEHKTTAKNSDGNKYICEQSNVDSRWRWLELPMWLAQHSTATKG